MVQQGITECAIAVSAFAELQLKWFGAPRACVASHQQL
jgi:hypothetical protein